VPYESFGIDYHINGVMQVCQTEISWADKEPTVDNTHEFYDLSSLDYYFNSHQIPWEFCHIGNIYKIGSNQLTFPYSKHFLSSTLICITKSGERKS
jgi:hypothetical protein